MGTAGALIVAAFLLGNAKADPESYTLPEQKLAFLDLKGKAPSDSMVKEYAALLDRLEIKCRESRSLIGDYAYAGGEELKVSAYQFLKAMNGSIPDEAPRSRCLEIAAAIVTLSRKS